MKKISIQFLLAMTALLLICTGAGAQRVVAGKAENIQILNAASVENPSTQGLSMNYYLSKKINGVVKHSDGTPVVARFYIQDISQNPPVLVATHITGVDGRYEFMLEMGQWRVVPISSSYLFEPRVRDYNIGLDSMAY